MSELAVSNQSDSALQGIIDQIDKEAEIESKKEQVANRLASRSAAFAFACTKFYRLPPHPSTMDLAHILIELAASGKGPPHYLERVIEKETADPTKQPEKYFVLTLLRCALDGMSVSNLSDRIDKGRKSDLFFSGVIAILTDILTRFVPCAPHEHTGDQTTTARVPGSAGPPNEQALIDCVFAATDAAGLLAVINQMLSKFGDAIALRRIEIQAALSAKIGALGLDQTQLPSIRGTMAVRMSDPNRGWKGRQDCVDSVRELLIAAQAICRVATAANEGGPTAAEARNKKTAISPPREFVKFNQVVISTLDQENQELSARFGAPQFEPHPILRGKRRKKRRIQIERAADAAFICGRNAGLPEADLDAAIRAVTVPLQMMMDREWWNELHDNQTTDATKEDIRKEFRQLWDESHKARQRMWRIGLEVVGKTKAELLPQQISAICDAGDEPEDSPSEEAETAHVDSDDNGPMADGGGEDIRPVHEHIEAIYSATDTKSLMNAIENIQARVRRIDLLPKASKIRAALAAKLQSMGMPSPPELSGSWRLSDSKERQQEFIDSLGECFDVSYAFCRVAIKPESPRQSSTDGLDQPQNGGADASSFEKDTRTKRRRGRRVETNLEQDERIFNAWATRHFKTHEELANELHLSARNVKLAIDRERKRRVAEKNGSQEE